MPAAVASSVITAISASRKLAVVRVVARRDSTPPLVATLITSAPARTSSRTRLRTSSGPSTTPLGRPGCGSEERHLGAADAPVVAVATGLAEHDDRDLHPRARGSARGRPPSLTPEVGAAGVAHAGDADVQRLLAGSRAALKNCRLNGVSIISHAGSASSITTCTWQSKKPGGDERARAVDRLVAVEAGADLDDAAVLDDHVALGRDGRWCRRTRAPPLKRVRSCDVRLVAPPAWVVGRHARIALTLPRVPTMIFSEHMFTRI